MKPGTRVRQRCKYIMRKAKVGDWQAVTDAWKTVYTQVRVLEGQRGTAGGGELSFS
eukprot:COSAG04_NODE_8949_length_913_cov_2.319410_1_plen_55_part_10